MGGVCKRGREGEGNRGSKQACGGVVGSPPPRGQGVRLSCQFLFKLVAQRVAGLPAGQNLVALATQPVFYRALALYGVSTVLRIWILGRMPLSQAYPWMSLGVVLVPALGVLMFGEKVRPVFWLGAGLIVAGIILTQYGSGPVGG